MAGGKQREIKVCEDQGQSGEQSAQLKGLSCPVIGSVPDPAVLGWRLTFLDGPSALLPHERPGFTVSRPKRVILTVPRKLLWESQPALSQDGLPWCCPLPTPH